MHFFTLHSDRTGLAFFYIHFFYRDMECHLISIKIEIDFDLKRRSLVDFADFAKNIGRW